MVDTDKVIRCECGFEARAAVDGRLVSAAQRHALEVHHMRFTAAELLARVTSPGDTTGGRVSTRDSACETTGTEEEED